MFKSLLFIFLFLCSFFCQANENYGFKGRVAVGIGIILGSQNNNVNVSLNGVALGRFNNILLESNAGITFDVFLTKFGVKDVSTSLRFEAGTLLGYNKSGSSVSPFYVGDIHTQQVFSKDNIKSFSGLGFGFQRNLIWGKLSNIANQKGLFIMRFSKNSSLTNVRIYNDFKAGFMFGGGTDKGETGTIILEHFFEGTDNILYNFGIGFEMITPEPDYSRNPDNPINSSYGAHPVLYGKEPNSNLFHGNFYLIGKMATSHFSQKIKLGIDSQRLAGYLQNALHDSFGLYPRFAWNLNKKNKLFFQSESMLHTK